MIMMVCAVTAFGQRNVDWSVDTILTNEVTSNTTQGSIFNIEAVFKNNGPDTVLMGDTVAYQFVVLNSNDQPMIAVPQTGLGAYLFNRRFEPGDTMHFHLRLVLNTYYTTSFNCKLRVSSAIFNRTTPGGVASEQTATAANNIYVKPVIWYNPQGWGVGINDVEVSPIMLYPNPAVNTAVISFNQVNVTEQSNIEVYDLNGRLLHSQQVVAGARECTLNTTNLQNGFYIVKVGNSAFQSEQKIQIQK